MDVYFIIFAIIWQVYIQAIQDYFKRKCNPRKIIKYAKEFNLESKVRN